MQHLISLISVTISSLENKSLLKYVIQVITVSDRTSSELKQEKIYMIHINIGWNSLGEKWCLDHLSHVA